MENKVIFLDIDGVITSARTGWHNLDIYAVNFLRWFCKESGAKIVISSTWRYNHDAEFWRSIFGDYMHDSFRTTRAHLEIRGLEIEDWLRSHPEVTEYLILDDDSDMLDDQKDRLILTDAMNGLLFEGMCKMLELFDVQSLPRQKDIYQHDNMFEDFNRDRP